MTSKGQDQLPIRKSGTSIPDTFVASRHPKDRLQAVQKRRKVGKREQSKDDKRVDEKNIDILFNFSIVDFGEMKILVLRNKANINLLQGVFPVQGDRSQSV